jgi:hypothetical protein
MVVKQELQLPRLQSSPTAKKQCSRAKEAGHKSKPRREEGWTRSSGSEMTGSKRPEREWEAVLLIVEEWLLNTSTIHH